MQVEYSEMELEGILDFCAAELQKPDLDASRRKATEIMRNKTHIYLANYPEDEDEE